MLAYSVKINGDHAGVCGFNDWAVLTATLAAGRGKAERALDGIEFRVGGLERGSEDSPAHFVRFVLERLDVGDKIEIEIVESEVVMEPLRRYRSDREVQESPFTDEELERMERETYEELKAKFEPER